MANIPPEIWFHIAKFVPNQDLRDLLGVNSIFFDISMDIRYRQVLITTRAIIQSMKTLKRLSDPFIASRVHRLSLELTHIKGFSPPLNSNSTLKSSSHFRNQLQHTIIRVFGSSKSPRLQPVTVTFTDFINEIISTTNHLVNVRELFIDSWHLPLSYDPQPLFSSFWSSFGPKLHTLSLSGNLEGYRTLINSSPTFDGLQELRIEFTNNIFRVDTDADGVILVDVLLPFINNLAPYLVSLRLWSWAYVDLSAFFSQLAPFPGLKTLNVRTAFNKAFGDASGLKGLIRDSSGTLQRVDLRLNPTGLTVDPSSEESLSRFLLECVSDERFFSQLRVLDIYPTNLAAGMDFLLGCIQRTSKSLEELIVRDRYWQDGEIAVVLDAVSSCSNLTYLRMNIWRLDVALTDRMALKLPRIDRLWLSIGENAANEPNALIDTFCQDLSKRSYINWKLKDITIWQNGQEADSDTMLAIARSIPSLTSFFSNGHMHLHQGQTSNATANTGFVSNVL
ncbi:hypothetical protein BYT27DRAFT_7188646 [Phlegmacium glaucopus]|nr:hypothetical protein BYT27DRAFT_7188646 [Phlegmacium glaucopus]